MAYSVSERYREQCYAGSSLYDCRLIIGENTIPISQIQSITISSPIIDDSQETFYIGTFISQKLTIQFKNLDGIDTTSGTNVELYISQYVDNAWVEVPIGKYIIDESPENYYQSSKIECLDYAIKFGTNVDYSPAFVDGKIKIDDLLRWLCSYFGVTLGDFPDTNGEVEVGSYDSTISGKRWISYIAEIKGCNAKMDRLGQLTLVPLKSPAAVTIDALESKSWELGEKFEVSKVTYFDAIRNYTFGDDTENTLILRQDNPFVVDESVVRNVYEKLRLDSSIVEEGTNFTIENTVEGEPIQELALKGQTSQASTPTPSSPQPINVVTGRQEINVCGKNIAKSFYVNNVTSAYQGVLYVDFYLKPNTTYTISFNGTNGDKYYFNENIFTTSPYITIANERLTKTLTTKSEVPTSQYTSGKGWLILKNQSGNTNANVFSEVQIEKGNQETTYEIYQGNTQLISLGVENLFDKSILVQGSCNYGNTGNVPSYDSTGTNRFTIKPDNAIEVKPNTTYTFNMTYNNDFALAQMTSEKVSLGDTGWKTTSNLPFTITTSATTKYIAFNFKKDSSTTIDTIKTYNYQLEKGSKANSYTPYGTTPIELNKIGNYQDYIYKTDKWYLHKEIGKVVLDGSESGWSYPSTNRFNLDGYFNDYLKSQNNITYLCDNYTAYNQTINNNDFNNLVANVDYGFNLSSTTSDFYTIRFKDTRYSDLATFKTNLGTNNVVIYYALATPTNTEITNNELLGQLNNFGENAIFYGGVTNITSTCPITFKSFTSDPFICYSLKTENFGDLSLDAWDNIHYTLGNEDYYTLNNNTITYEMTVMSKVETKIPTKQQEVTTNVVEGNEEQRIRKVQTNVNSLTGEVSLLSSRVDDDEESIGELRITSENIQTNVSSMNENLTNQISTLQSSTSFQINAINQTLENGVEKLANSLVTIDANGINTSRSDETFNTQITNKTFEVKDGDNEISFMGYDSTLNKTVARINELEARQITAGVHRTEIIEEDSELWTADYYIGDGS